MRDAAKCQHDAQLWQRCDARLKERAAGGDLGRCRFVFWRHAAHGVADHAAFQLQAIIGARFVAALGKPEFQQCRVKENSGMIACEGPARTIGAVATRCQANDEQLCVIATKRRDRAIEPGGLFA